MRSSHYRDDNEALFQWLSTPGEHTARRTAPPSIICTYAPRYKTASDVVRKFAFSSIRDKNNTDINNVVYTHIQTSKNKP